MELIICLNTIQYKLLYPHMSMLNENLLKCTTKDFEIRLHHVSRIIEEMHIITINRIQDIV